MCSLSGANHRAHRAHGEEPGVVSVSHALGTAQKEFALIGAINLLFDCNLPLFIVRALEKPTAGWYDFLFISLALLGRVRHLPPCLVSLVVGEGSGGVVGAFCGAFFRCGQEGYVVNWD